jgi:hypothetical protein
MYEYFLIHANSAEEMNQKVNEMGAQGWELFLGLTVGWREYQWRSLFQWMCRIAPHPVPLRPPPNVGREKQREA